jgi:hypothetical protein
MLEAIKIYHEPEPAIERVNMNRIEFMRQLEGLLQNIPVGEREEAIQYYNDYFDDAGVEREPDVIEALGNPARVASTIQKELYENEENAKKSVKASDRVLANYETPESEERVPKLYFGALDDEVVKKDATKNDDTYGGITHGDDVDTSVHVDQSRAEGGSGGFADSYSTDDVIIPSGGRSGTAGANGWGNNSVLIAVVIGGVILLPFIITLLSGIFGGIIGIIAGWFGAILGFGITALALFVASVVLVISGVMMALSNPILGIGLIGGGLFALGFGFLFLMLTIWMAGTATPWIIKELKKLLDKLYQFIKKNISKVKKWGEQR